MLSLIPAGPFFASWNSLSTFELCTLCISLDPVSERHRELGPHHPPGLDKLLAYCTDPSMVYSLAYMGLPGTCYFESRAARS